MCRRLGQGLRVKPIQAGWTLPVASSQKAMEGPPCPAPADECGWDVSTVTTQWEMHPTSPLFPTEEALSSEASGIGGR